MLLKRFMSIGCATVMVFSLAMIGCQSVAQQKTAEVAAPQAKPTIAKSCMICHQAQEGNVRGNFENVAFKSKSIQLKINDDTEILKFDEKTIKVITADKTEEAEALRDIKKGHEVRIAFTEKNGIKTASLVSVKPPIKVAPEKLMTTTEVEKLVALGPEKGKYTLIDARPAPRFMEGAIPTAINIPYPAFDKMTAKLPMDKNALIVYYCAGVT